MSNLQSRKKVEFDIHKAENLGPYSKPIDGNTYQNNPSPDFKFFSRKIISKIIIWFHIFFICYKMFQNVQTL